MHFHLSQSQAVLFHKSPKYLIRLFLRLVWYLPLFLFWFSGVYSSINLFYFSFFFDIYPVNFDLSLFISILISVTPVIPYIFKIVILFFCFLLNILLSILRWVVAIPLNCVPTCQSPSLYSRHINLQYTLHKMKRAKTPSCKRCGVKKETPVHILCECLGLEKVRMQTLGFARMDLEQIKEARLSGIVAVGKWAGLLNSPLWI